MEICFELKTGKFWSKKYIKQLTVSSHNARKQSTSFNKKQTLTELTAICIIAKGWGEPTRQ